MIDEWRETRAKQNEEPSLSRTRDVIIPFGEDKNQGNTNGQTDSLGDKALESEKVEVNGTSEGVREILNSNILVNKIATPKCHREFSNEKNGDPSFMKKVK